MRHNVPVRVFLRSVKNLEFDSRKGQGFKYRRLTDMEQ